MRGITQNLIITIVTAGFLALSASSFPTGSAAAPTKTTQQFCAPGVCLPSQRCCVRYGKAPGN
jgi:hypothetical protein